MDPKYYTKEQVLEIVDEAKFAARLAAENYFQVVLGGRDQYACGFAWVEIYGVKGSTKLGKIFKAINLDQLLWNPAKFPAQNVDTLYAGAEAAANVLTAHGFRAYACSRLD